MSNVNARKDKTPLVIGISAAVIAAVVIGSIAYVNRSQDGIRKTAEANVRQEVAAEREEQKQLKASTIQYLTVEHTPAEIEKTLLLAFSKLEPEDNDAILDRLLMGTYNLTANTDFTDEMASAVYDTMDAQKHFDIHKIENEEIKKQLVDLDNQHIAVMYLNGQLFLNVNYRYFCDTYKDYLTDGYLAILDFYAEQNENDYCDTTGTKLYANVVENRMDKLYQIMQENPNTEFFDIASDSYFFYKSVYFGAYSQDYIFDDTKIKDDVLRVYKDYATRCQDPEMVDFINQLLSEYAEVDNDYTVYIQTLIKEYCGFYVEETTDYNGTVIDESEIIDAADLAASEESHD